MCRVARVQYRKKQPAPCDFCGILIRCDMFRHVAQLWRCPVSWCTAWKGTPQDLLDHVRNAHNVPERVQDIRLETLVPPWTVTRQVYTESLTSRHSGISNDVLLLSDIGLLLVHHYRVHKRGLPHVAFRRNYMSQLRALLVIKSLDVGCTSPRPSKRAFARRRPTRVMETPVRIAPVSHYRTHSPRQGLWCWTVVLKRCRGRWMLPIRIWQRFRPRLGPA